MREKADPALTGKNGLPYNHFNDALRQDLNFEHCTTGGSGMKIYFCGSIRGGRTDAALYREMIEFLKQYGCVLTEHVGDASLTDRGGDGTNGETWRRDTAWLKACDIVIAECSQPSLGVGYEIAFAEALGKPVHVFYGKSDGRLSAMLAGDPQISVHYYGEKETLFTRLGTVMDAAQRRKG